MKLPESETLAARLEILDRCGSTNTELAARAGGTEAGAWPEFSVLVTDDQTAGRGRFGRVWVAPRGKALAVSVLLRPRLADGSPLDRNCYGWLSLMAGVAASAAVARVLGEGSEPEHRVGVKWPNDVQVDGAKVAGLLAELLPDGGVVMGCGVNLALGPDELPTETSTSLFLNGARAVETSLADAVLSHYLRELRDIYSVFLQHGADAARSGVAERVAAECTSLGREVRVELPDGQHVVGRAESLDEAGRLCVRARSDARVVSVAAGDVTHLRYE